MMRYLRNALFAALATGVLWGASGFSQDATSHHPPAGLNASDWNSIRAEYERHRHAALPEPGGYRARNFAQQWMTHFDGRGFTVEPDSRQWTWGLELDRYGFAGHERAVAGRATAGAELGRVSYRWGTALEEWFVNDGRGLEHGYTLKRRPDGARGPLQIYLGVRGSLQPRVAQDGRTVSFVDRADRAVVNYAGLKVWDADGKALAARFEAAEGGLRLAVDEAGARYPLTIDPIAQQAYLKASNAEASDVFGFSVAVSGDTVVVGAFGEDSNATGVNGDQTNNSASDSGAAYVFVRSGGVWSQQAYLKASNTGADDRFGESVAISGDTVVVGAQSESSSATGVNGDQNNNSASDSGAAYVFVRSGGVWSQQAYLKASNTETRDRFGLPVAVSGDTVAVGAHREDSSATGVNGDQGNNSGFDSGAAYVFVRSGSTWSQEAYLKASNPGINDRFGFSVAVSDDTVVVGAHLESSDATGVNGDQANNNALNSGAAYVFVRSGGTWSQQAYLKASNTGPNDSFGWSVAVSDDTVVVGADQEDSSATGVNGDQTNNNAQASGAAYVFVRSGGVWGQQAYLKASNTGVGDFFGESVAVSGDTVVVGARLEDSNATGVNGDQTNDSANNSGAAYVFVRSGSTWSQQAYLKASNTDANDQFGRSVAVSGDTVVIGAPGEASNATGVNSDQTNDSAPGTGAAYVFTLPPVVSPYNFSGFRSPVSNPPTVNTGKAGRAYPLKWQLTNASGAFVTELSAVTSITYQSASCGNFIGDPVNSIVADTPGNSGLRYDSVVNEYQYNWKTPSQPGCYQLLLTLDTGQVFTANFMLQ